MEVLMEWDHPLGSPHYTDNYSLFFILISRRLDLLSGLFRIILTCHSMKNTGVSGNYVFAASVSGS